MTRPVLSLCLIVKNEAAYLDRCLASYRGVADEIIVVDTGSSDNSPDIARQYHAKVIQTGWEGDFSKARNLSLEQATGTWLLWTDADDVIDSVNGAKIKQLISGAAPDRCFGFMIKNTQDGVLGSVFNQIRLFPNHPTARFRYRVHEQVLPSLQESGFQTIFTDIMVMHTGYSSPDVVKQKQIRNLAILEKEVVERPDNPVIAYSYAGNLLDLDRFQEAVPWYEKALRFSLAQHAEEHIAQAVPVALASLYGRLKDFNQSRLWAKKALLQNPDNVQLWSILGELAEVEEKTDEAIRCFEKVLTYQEKPVLIPVDVHMLQINACSHLGGLYMKKGDKQKVVDILDKAIEIKSGRKVLPSERGDRYLSMGDTIKAGQEYLTAVNDSASKDWAAFHGLAKVFILNNSAQDAADTLKLGLDRFPDQPDLMLLLADLYDDLKRFELSLPLYRRVLPLLTDPEQLERVRQRLGRV
ncbi:MAG: hypothetical protein A2293_12800 [Elusimicrobia bacterium RIFOXYB2_FULL_49_7]|nr:MAG: hypothetical protein A2293_12800 [Elusimicrobia bacterium RIFOXYB2_FULL_49_7]